MCKIEDLNQYLSIEQLKDAIKDSNSEKGLIEMFYTFECLQQFMSDVDQMIELFAN